MSNNLSRLGFRESGDNMVLSHNIYWHHPSDEKEDELLYSLNLYYDREHQFFTLETTNEHGHYSDMPLPHIENLYDVQDLWKSLTGVELKLLPFD